jgi:hypothetical protein
MRHAHEDLKTIRFAGELLPNWAQLLDLAAALCPLPEETNHWFSRFTLGSGVEDSRLVIEHCLALQAGLQKERGFIANQLRQGSEDQDPEKIVSAWQYALATMIQAAESRKTCAWIIEGTGELIAGDSDGGDITLRRV